jgi:hypothetical protein
MRGAGQEPEKPVTPQVYTPSKTPTPSKPGMLQEVFNLDEGPVTLTFPESLSEESYQDLASYFELFLRKAKRRTVPLQGVEARGITGKDKEAAN